MHSSMKVEVRVQFVCKDLTNAPWIGASAFNNIIVVL